MQRLSFGGGDEWHHHYLIVTDYSYCGFIDISLKVREKLYSSCVQSSMLHGSETWPVRK